LTDTDPAGRAVGETALSGPWPRRPGPPWRGGAAGLSACRARSDRRGSPKDNQRGVGERWRRDASRAAAFTSLYCVFWRERLKKPSGRTGDATTGGRRQRKGACAI